VGACKSSKVVGSKSELMISVMCINMFADVDFIIFVVVNL